jgi:hypothetical protein
VSTEWRGTLETVYNKETYFVDDFLAILLIKNDRPQTGRFVGATANQLNYRSFLA